MLEAVETGRTLRSGSIRLVPIQVKGRSSRNLIVVEYLFNRLYYCAETLANS